MRNHIGYSDLIEIFKDQISEPEGEGIRYFVAPGFVLKTDGIWIEPPTDDAYLTIEERATLCKHPKKDLTIPALSFPCTSKQLEDFIDYYGMQDVLDLNVLAVFQGQQALSQINMKIMEDCFPELSLQPLRLKARRWAETFYSDAPIKKIVLYAYCSKYAGALAERQRSTGSSRNRQLPKFAIVFEIDADDETQKMNIEEEVEYAKKKARGLVEEMPWDKLLRDIHYHETASDRRYPQLLQSDFCSVYKNPPANVPFKDWDFEIKFRNSELQDSVRDEHFEARVVLYTKSDMDEIEGKIAFNDEGFLPGTKLIAMSRFEEWQCSKTEWAIKNGSIRASYLVCIMAYDHSYLPHLKDYWATFQMDIDGDQCPDPSTFVARVNIWAALFQRWTHGDVLGINLSNQLIMQINELDPIVPLDYETAVFEDSEGERISFHTINLNKLKDFLFKWEIPLPSRLFPAKLELDSQKESRDFDRDLIARKAMREGYITIIDLVGVLADDKIYINILSYLFEKFLHNTYLPKHIKPETFEGRHWYWMNIIRRWGGMESEPQKLIMPGIKYLNCYYRDKIATGEFLIINREDQQPEYTNQNHFFNLIEFKEYLKTIEFDLQISLPFPKLLQLDSKSDTESEREPIDELILGYGKAAEKLYRCMVKRLKIKGKNLTNATMPDLKEAAAVEFDNNPAAFSPLTKTHIEGDALYNPAEKQKRQTIGMILRCALMSKPTIESDYQKLYSRFCHLKSSKLDLSPKKVPK